jgi:site-specific recombinase XerD
MRIIENNELNDILIKVVTNKLLYWEWSRYYFEDLYMTGCRPTELLELERWKFSERFLILTTKKTDEERIIPLVDVTGHFLRCLIENNPTMH